MNFKLIVSGASVAVFGLVVVLTGNLALGAVIWCLGTMSVVKGLK